ncbi:MAG: GxxExxY protein [Thermotogae bacterium]|nr:GxxExxY protein [Thermotogota bacterium]
MLRIETIDLANTGNLEKLADEIGEGLANMLLLLVDIRDEILNVLGEGFDEKIYQAALEKELMDRRIAFWREVYIPIIYKNTRIGFHMPDFIVEGYGDYDRPVIVELKAKNSKNGSIPTAAKKQVETYLRSIPHHYDPHLRACRAGILLDFGFKRETLIFIAKED